MAIGVNSDGYREVIGAAEGLKGVKMIVGDKCSGMCESVNEVLPEAKNQRCTVHFYRNVFSATHRNRMREVTRMLKAIHAQESKEAARKKGKGHCEAASCNETEISR